MAFVKGCGKYNSSIWIVVTSHTLTRIFNIDNLPWLNGQPSSCVVCGCLQANKCLDSAINLFFLPVCVSRRTLRSNSSCAKQRYLYASHMNIEHKFDHTAYVCCGTEYYYYYSSCFHLDKTKWCNQKCFWYTHKKLRTLLYIMTYNARTKWCCSCLSLCSSPFIFAPFSICVANW